MFVAPHVEDLVGIAWSLTTHPRAVDAGIAVRAGLAYGPVLMQDGDYFGAHVNLAARLVAVASPGQVLIAPGLEAGLGPEWQLTDLPPQLLRGFDEPVIPCAILPRGHDAWPPSAPSCPLGDPSAGAEAVGEGHL
jgi:class 3 adenylate cyclase